jgi:actin related protein 2/3 complex subunit 5
MKSQNIVAFFFFSFLKQLKNATVVYSSVVGIREADLDNALNGLTNDQLDVLMKYLYRFMSMSASWDEKDERFKDSAKILKLHAKLVEKAGVGSIVRAFSERKTV